MEGFVAGLSNGEAEKKISSAVDTYSAAFTRVLNSILHRIPVISEPKQYNDALQEESAKEFPGAPKPLFHVAHWMLSDNGLIDHGSSVTVRYSGTGVESVAKKGVQNYLLTIVARAEGPEKVDEMDRCLKGVADTKKRQVADLISHNGYDRRQIEHDPQKILDAMDKAGVKVSPYVSAGEQVGTVIDIVRPLIIVPEPATKPEGPAPSPPAS